MGKAFKYNNWKCYSYSSLLSLGELVVRCSKKTFKKTESGKTIFWVQIDMLKLVKRGWAISSPQLLQRMEVSFCERRCCWQKLSLEFRKQHRWQKQKIIKGSEECVKYTGFCLMKDRLSDLKNELTTLNRVLLKNQQFFINCDFFHFPSLNYWNVSNQQLCIYIN